MLENFYVTHEVGVGWGSNNAHVRPLQSLAAAAAVEEEEEVVVVVVISVAVVVVVAVVVAVEEEGVVNWSTIIFSISISINNSIHKYQEIAIVIGNLFLKVNACKFQ